MAPMQFMMAVAKVYTLLFAAVVLWVLLNPSYFGPQPDRLVRLGPGTALLAVGWTWLLLIRRSARQP
jgi:ABC-type transport system involved in cytochrome c biogenesis permease component